MALLTDAQIDEALGALEGWRRDGDQLVCDRQAADFAGALALVNAAGEVAERLDHHPDLLLHGWNKVRVSVSTHSEGGITDKDVELARAVSDLP